MANEGSSSNSRLLVVGALVLVLGVVLVLLIVRGNLGGDESAASQASPTETATADDGDQQSSDTQTPLTNAEVMAGRLQLPLEIPEGLEAMAVRADYVRSVAGVPLPGDRVNLYRLPGPDEGGETAAQPEDQTPTATTQLPPAGPDAELLVSDVEVLGATGATPGAIDGPVNFVLAVDPADVPGVMAVANVSDLWLTLLPAADEAEDATAEDGA